MGVKERRTKLLLCVFLLTDANRPLIELNEVFYKISDIPQNAKTKSNIKKLIQEGLLQKSDDNDMYSLTKKGHDELSLEFPYVRYRTDSWDGVWRIVSYEIPEKKREIRDRLRREVAGWGLGPWHRSFWITPHPIIAPLRLLIEGKEEAQYIQAFEASHLVGDRDNLIEKVWQKSKLQELYKTLFKTWHEILSADGEKYAKLTSIMNKYIDVLRTDPGLPKELSGDQWIGYEAHGIFTEIKEILLSE